MLIDSGQLKFVARNLPRSHVDRNLKVALIAVTDSCILMAFVGWS